MFFANQQSNSTLAKNIKKSNGQSNLTNNFKIASSSYKRKTAPKHTQRQMPLKTISSSKSLPKKINMAKCSQAQREIKFTFSFKMPCLNFFFIIIYFLLFNDCFLCANSENLIQTYDQLNSSLFDRIEEEQFKMLKRREEIEKIKSETLIDVFKTKILKLLNVDQVPSPTEINIAHNSIPEPILKEYHRLIRVSRMERNKKYNIRNKYATETRGSRDLESDENELEHEDIFDEAIRFNGSVVQRVMILPNKRIYIFFKRSYLNESESKYKFEEFQLLRIRGP